MAATLVKICGLRTIETVDASIDAGADFLGFVFFPPSPRCVQIDLASALVSAAKGRVHTVGLFVDPEDAHLDAVLQSVDLDSIQLHGKETPERAAHIANRFNRRIIKAFSVSEADDLDRASDYAEVADYFLFDAKPPKDANRPGGNAEAFDWTLLSGRSWTTPWFLAGGITPDNVANAVRTSGARMVDASSSLESALGVKDPHLIRQFVTAAKSV